MSCNVGKAMEGLENEFDVGEVTERLERFISLSSRFQKTDDNAFLAISPADLIT